MIKPLSIALQDFKLSSDLYSTIDFKKHKWDILEHILDPVIFKEITMKTDIEGLHRIWDIKETFDNKVCFNIIRNKSTLQRITKIDFYGLIGLSSIDLNNRHCFLTEGVSDFISAKLLYPNENVLGMTTLQGSFKAKCIYTNIFEEFTLISDNDFNKDKNTGLFNASRLRETLLNLGKKVQVEVPDTSFNDLTDNFIFRLKLGSVA